jgi:murein L,D-transpeptidase YafK
MITVLRSSIWASLVAGVMVYGHLFGFGPPEPLTDPIDRIVIEKAERRMILYRDGVPLRVYRIALGFAPEGDKERQGDGRTPEGTFRINRRNPESEYYLSLGIDYPQRDDLIRASAGGYSPGGDNFIHGQPEGVTGRQRIKIDWTAGCIAVTNEIMDELWRVVAMGTEVEIRP